MLPRVANALIGQPPEGNLRVVSSKMVVTSKVVISGPKETI